VRRGLTLVIHEGALDAADWSALPFNLKELQVLSLESDEESRNKLAQAIRDGWHILNSSPGGYRDLPVFDIVRRPVRRTVQLPVNKIEILVLCPFSATYTRDTWQRFRMRVAGIPEIVKGDVELLRVIDYSSPLLVGERLYELTRFVGQCVVDWTGWRANVFFEMGVRLAVHRMPPICVINVDDRIAEGAAARRTLASRKSLEKLFSPWPYSFKDDTKLREFKERLHSELSPDLPNSNQPNFVYPTAEANLYLDQEYGHTRFHEEIIMHVEATLGQDLQMEGKLPFLYSGNRARSHNAIVGLLDALAASRYLLQRKIVWAESEDEKSTYRKGLSDVESMMKGILDTTNDPAFEFYRKEVGEEVQ
jgi:hypothetical protein